jgi:hypothetical protein
MDCNEAEKLKNRCENKTAAPYRVIRDPFGDCWVEDSDGKRISSIHDIDGHPGQE